MRTLLAAFLVVLPLPGLAQRVVETTSDAPIFLASGAPRAEFARAYIPDGGSNTDIFVRDLGYLGIAHEEYVPLTNANILQALQDPDMVTVVPASLLGAPPVGFLFEGGYFAFQSTPEGLSPLSVRRPDGVFLEAVDLGPLGAAPPSVIGPHSEKTTLVASTGLPTQGLVDFDLYAMRVDRALLAQVLGRAGLSVGEVQLGGADRIAEGPQAGGPALMFMAVSQNDPALANTMQGGDVKFHVITNFGLVPARPAAAVSVSKPRVEQGFVTSDAPEGGTDDAVAENGSRQKAVSRVAEPGNAAASEGPTRKAEMAGPRETARPQPPVAAPPAPDALAAALPPAKPARYDPTDHDAVILVTPVPLRPETLKRIELVWRFVVGPRDARQELPFYDRTDNGRTSAMLARIAAIADVTPRGSGVFDDLTIPGAALPDQILLNMSRISLGLIMRLEDLASPELDFFRQDPRLSFWQPTMGGFARVEITKPSKFDTVALSALPDGAPIALVRPGTTPEAAESVGGLFVASRDAHSRSPSPSTHRRDPLNEEARQRFARQLDRDVESIVRTGVIVELDAESGRIPEPWPTDMLLMQAQDLRAPLMEDVLDGADAYLIAYGQQTPIIGEPPATDAAPEAARATRGPRAVVADEQGPLVALPRDGGEQRTMLGVPSPHTLFLEAEGNRYRLASNGRQGGQRIISLSAAIDMNDPVGTRERLSQIFSQPYAAVLLNHNPGSVPSNDMALPFYDVLFDGSRKFVRLGDWREVQMPTHPGFAPPAIRSPAGVDTFCGQSGAFALFYTSTPAEPVGVLASDLDVVPLARDTLQLDFVRLAHARTAGEVQLKMEMKTMAFSSPSMALSYFGSENICNTVNQMSLE